MVRIGISGWRYEPWRGVFYVYFDNDVKVRAPFDALNLMKKVHLAWRPRAARHGRRLVPATMTNS